MTCFLIADLNATIGMDRLSAEVITKLDQNGSGGSGVVAGSIISVPMVNLLLMGIRFISGGL